MADATVVVTDPDFPDLPVERRELADVADVVHGETTTTEAVRDDGVNRGRKIGLS